jgi:Flp pilus assembly protein TadD
MIARSPILLLCSLTLLSACASTNEPAALNFGQLREAASQHDSMEEARLALRARDFDRAHEILRNHVVVNPDDDDAKLSLAEAYIGRGEGRNARTVLETLSKEARDRPTAFTLHGLALLASGRLEEATAQLGAAIGRDADQWRAWNALGLVHDARREWAAARTSYHKALSLRDDAAIVHNNFGYSLLLQGNVDEAIESFSRALSLDTRLVVARENLRLAFAAKGSYARAVAGAQKRDLARVLNNIGYVAMLRGDYSAAEAYFARAIEESPVYYQTAVENQERLRQLRPEGEEGRQRALF